MTNKQNSWDQTFLKIAQEIATHSTCGKTQVGAVLTIDRRIISTGFNGVPAGITPHCCDIFKPEDFNCSPADEGSRHTEHAFYQLENEIHAEINAILFAAKHGISTLGATIYLTMNPCPACANALINAGVIRVVYIDEYRITKGIDILKQVNINVEQIKI